MGMAMPKQGLCMYQMDLEGHGYSGGERAYIEDYNHWVDDYRRVRYCTVAGRLSERERWGGVFVRLSCNTSARVGCWNVCSPVQYFFLAAELRAAGVTAVLLGGGMTCLYVFVSKVRVCVYFVFDFCVSAFRASCKPEVFAVCNGVLCHSSLGSCVILHLVLHTDLRTVDYGPSQCSCSRGLLDRLVVGCPAWAGSIRLGAPMVTDVKYPTTLSEARRLTLTCFGVALYSETLRPRGSIKFEPSPVRFSWRACVPGLRLRPDFGDELM